MSEQSTPHSAVRLVISGGIGSGKSTVAARLRELGGDVIDADLIGHAVLEPGGAAHEEVAARWPSVVRAGTVDRAALAEVVFSDPEALRDLEAMTHPAIAAEILERVAASDASLVAVELSVASDLVGAGWLHVVVEAPEELRIGRAVARGMEEGDVRRRMAAQPARDEWRKGAHFVVVNDGTEDDLVDSVDELWARLRGASAEDTADGRSDSASQGAGPGAGNVAV